MIHVKMIGLLEAVPADVDETEFLHEANMAAAQGKEFILLRKPDGRMRGFNVRNILTFEELDEEDADILA